MAHLAPLQAHPAPLRDHMAPLRVLCMQQLGTVFRDLNAGIQNCEEQTRAMDKRKTELLVELGTISDALEEVYACHMALRDSRQCFIDDVADAVPHSSVSDLLAQLEAAVPPAAVQPEPGRPAGRPAGPQPTADASSATKLPRKRQPRDSAAAPGGRACSEEKARRRDAALPSDEGERAALLRRQLCLCELPAGVLDEGAIEAVVNEAFRRVPAFGAADGDACTRVQVYGGGTYAFVTLREEKLALTAMRFPKQMAAGGKPMRLARPHGVQPSAGVAPLVVPPDWSMPDATEVRVAGGAAKVSLETKLYWSMRQAESPKPNEKEIREALAFFKQTNKLLRRKRLVVDVCGSHGLIGGLFVAFGKADAAVVLDKFEPGSFRQVCAAWARHIGGGDAGEGEGRCRLRFLRSDFKRVLPGLLAGGAASPAPCAELGLDGIDPSEIAVVACHACGHMSDEIIAMCIRAGADFAVMPCCHRDRDTQNQMALVAATLGTSEHAAIDAARVGSITARGYDCRWRTIDASISPENRILVGLAKHKAGTLAARAKSVEVADSKMGHLYAKIHHLQQDPHQEEAATQATSGSAVGATPADECVPCE